MVVRMGLDDRNTFSVPCRNSKVVLLNDPHMKNERLRQLVMGVASWLLWGLLA